jgi:membrane protein implicated in regulation of membrane protease activity
VQAPVVTTTATGECWSRHPPPDPGRHAAARVTVAAAGGVRLYPAGVDDPEVWRWIWLGVAALGFLGEILTAGSFFLLPFGVGAAVACLLAFADVPLAVQWIAFVGVSMTSVVLTRRLVRRVDATTTSEGIGAQRWIGQPATVLVAIGAGADGAGLVRVGREEWRAQSVDGRPVDAGTVVKVVEMRGTQLVVRQLPEEGP